MIVNIIFAGSKLYSFPLIEILSVTISKGSPLWHLINKHIPPLFSGAFEYKAAVFSPSFKKPRRNRSLSVKIVTSSSVMGFA